MGSPAVRVERVGKRKRVDGPPGRPKSSPKYDRHNLSWSPPKAWERKTPRRKESS